MTQTVYIDNDNRIKLSGLKDADGVFQNSAVVTVTLQDSTGANITGETWPLSMPHIAGSSGDYHAVLQDALPLTNNQDITAVVDVNSAGLTAQFLVLLTAKTRTIVN